MAKPKCLVWGLDYDFLTVRIYKLVGTGKLRKILCNFSLVYYTNALGVWHVSSHEISLIKPGTISRIWHLNKKISRIPRDKTFWGRKWIIFSNSPCLTCETLRSKDHWSGRVELTLLLPFQALQLILKWDQMLTAIKQDNMS